MIATDNPRGLPPGKVQLRPRHLYVRPAGAWVGFGLDLNTQPDLFETVYRCAWWRVAVCRYCLVTAIKNASGLLDQAEALLTQTRKKAGR